LNFPKVIIIILNWNGEKNTIECLNSINQIIYPNYDVIIIDSNSTDNSIEKIKSNFLNVNIIKNRKNLGFSGGFNVGIKKAIDNKADYIVCLNNDVIVDKNFIMELIKIGEIRSDIGGLYPMEYNYDQPNKINAAGGGTIKFILDSPIGHGEIDKGQYNQLRQVGRLCGAAIVLKKNVFLNIGLFDPDYFYGFEDTDISLRVIKAEYKIIFVPKSKIWHKISASSGGELNPYKSYYSIRNRFLFAKRNLTNKNKISYITYFFFYEVWFAIIYFLRQKKLSSLTSFLKGIKAGLIIFFSNNTML
jgi:GT2 family glycosyltransferase